MATGRQIEYVQEIEAAAAAIKIEAGNRTPTITEVLSLAGTGSTEMSAFTVRLRAGRELKLLTRMHEAFLSLGLNPKQLAQAVSDLTMGVERPPLQRGNEGSEAVEFIPSPVRPQPAGTNSAPYLVPQTEPAFSHVLGQVTDILDRVSPKMQKRVIMGLCGSYEVGG